MPHRISEWDAREVGDFYRQEAKALFRYGYRLMQGNRAAAEDIVQETFQEAAKRWTMLRALEDSRRRAWLFTVARNKVADRWRIDLREAPVLDVLSPADKMCDGVDVHQRVIDSIVLDKCWKAIKQMPSRQHQVAWLRWHDGCDTAQIGKLLGINSSTVRVHLRNARTALKSAVGPEVRFLDEAADRNQEDADCRDPIGGAEA
ncbi:RNA polymerase sigma factor [Kibdelosporangium aridum]|uniref:RNA polymerase sigma-70 factor, ECF subfamily n=1 Tax=Kibdelosporangium aridum TaxID=2030 RepID=A0A1Y5Y277_KIBAR|nr:sigma-70 family RNA polymerase sigma factor [Kibdelosporangium aridum]SMD22822.1 RNA polymerase sigma-70 factor, ECF subfamily [Kibdelosporangium aridum]